MLAGPILATVCGWDTGKRGSMIRSGEFVLNYMTETLRIFKD